MKISETLLKKIERHGEVDFPIEACGLLVGTFDAIVDAIPSPNLAASSNEFLIDAALSWRPSGQALACAQGSTSAG